MWPQRRLPVTKFQWPQKEVARQDGGGNDPASSATVNEDVALVPTAVVVEAVVHKNISPHVLLINLMYMSQARLKKHINILILFSGQSRTMDNAILTDAPSTPLLDEGAEWPPRVDSKRVFSPTTPVSELIHATRDIVESCTVIKTH